MIPLADAFAQVLSRKTALAIRRRWRKRLHGGGPGREDVAVGGKPVGLLAGLFLVFLGITVVEYLHLDAGRKPPFALFQLLDRFGGGPDKNPGVAAGLQMTPLGDQLEVCMKFFRSDHANGFARATYHPIGPAPSVRIAVDVDKMFLPQGAPAGSRAVNESFGWRSGLLRAGSGRRENAKTANHRSADTVGNESAHIQPDFRSPVGWPIAWPV